MLIRVLDMLIRVLDRASCRHVPIHDIVMDLVVELRGREFAGVKGDRVHDTVLVGLGDDGGNGKVGSVGLDRGGPIRVEVSEDGGCG